MVDDADEEQRKEQWRQGKQEEQLAEAQNRGEEDTEQRRTATESCKVEHREQQEKMAWRKGMSGGRERRENKCERKEGINGRLFVGGKRRP